MTAALPPEAAALARRWLGAGEVRLVETRGGLFNDIHIIAHGGRRHALKLRARPQGFRYEADLVKEAWALAALAGMDGPEEGTPPHPLLPELRACTGPGEAPACLMEAVEGRLLAEDQRAEHWRRVGAGLAVLHACRRPGFAEGVDGRGPWRGDWGGFTAARLAPLQAEARALGWLPGGLAAGLAALPSPAGQDAPCVLVHNDIHPGNIVLAGSLGVTFLDWDNWLPEAPELDWAKLDAWTRLTPRGLVPDAGFGAAARQGYGAVPDPGRLFWCGLLWSLRAGCFSAARGDAPGMEAAAARIASLAGL